MINNKLVQTFLVCFTIILLFAPFGALAEGLKIGFILKTMQEDRYSIDKSLFIDRAGSQGAEVVFSSSANNERLQLEQVEKMLDDGCQVIVLQPSNTGTAGSLVKLAHKQGVKVVGYDSMLQNGPLDVMVMQDSWAVGRLQAESMVRWLIKKKGAARGNVVLIKGQPGDANAEALSSGVLEIVEKHPGLSIIAQRSHINWFPHLAQQTTETLLVKHRNKIDAFICNNSGLAGGVISALEIEGLADANNVFVAGSDADIRNIRFIAQGKQAFEVWKKIKPLAYKAADIAVLLAKDPGLAADVIKREAKAINNGYMDVPTFITPVIPINKATINDTIIKDGFYTNAQVYGDYSSKKTL